MKRSMKYIIRTVSLVTLIVLVFGLGFVTGAGHLPVFAQANSANGSRSSDVEKLFVPFWEAWDAVQDQYLDPPSQDLLMQGAITGMINALNDRNSAYMDPKLYESLNDEMSDGAYEGIGASIRKDPITGNFTVVSTIIGSPAQKGGLRVGDIIVSVDGKEIRPLTQTQLLGVVRGPAGTAVKLGVLRKGAETLVDVIITRARIEMPTVTFALYEGNIGYVKLADFNDLAVPELNKALTTLDANNLNGLILDLRDDPGGFLQTAIDVAHLFLPRGPYVLERGRNNEPVRVPTPKTRTLVPDVPVVVLINGGSASASELVAGALRDRGRAILVGETSYGKGSVQAWSRLSNGGGLRLTIAHFFTPTGGVINGIGLRPDVYVPWDMVASPDNDPQLAEAIWILKGKF
jgi:carboxyl-terminal processing protease